jgi:hypothetical protein
MSGVECPEAVIGFKIRAIPQSHQSEYPHLNPPLSGLAVTFKKMQFLQALEYPVGEIYLNAVWIENFSVEFIRQGFAHPSWLITELQPAHIGFLQTHTKKKTALPVAVCRL